MRKRRGREVVRKTESKRRGEEGVRKKVVVDKQRKRQREKNGD